MGGVLFGSLSKIRNIGTHLRKPENRSVGIGVRLLGPSKSRNRLPANSPFSPTYRRNARFARPFLVLFDQGRIQITPRTPIHNTLVRRFAPVRPPYSIVFCIKVSRSSFGRTSIGYYTHAYCSRSNDASTSRLLSRVRESVYVYCLRYMCKRFVSMSQRLYVYDTRSF